MKLVHLSDLHLGKRVNEYSMLEDQKFILTQILDVVRGEAPDGVIIAGDVYDKSVPSAEAVELFDDFLNRLAALHLQVFVISGNHDSAERIAFGGRLMDRSGVHMAPVYHGKVEPVVLSDAFGPVNIWMLPFIKPVNVRRFYGEGGTLVPEGGEGEPCDTYESALATAVRHMDVNAAERNILITHQFVTGASRTDSEEQSVGGTDAVGSAVFAPFDYVALGHIHRPQNMGRGEKPGQAMIRYCGTPLKYSFSEAKDEKSITIVEIGAKTEVAAPADFITLRTVPLAPLRDLREIRGSYSEVTDRSSYEGTNTEDYIHITLTDEGDVPDAFIKLRQIYHQLMRLDYDNTRTRTGGTILREEADLTKSPMELMSDFYEQQNGRPLGEEQRAYLEKLTGAVFEGGAR
ncbi:Exodeoxyribonuclease I subunit D [Lachnospiraceae bacterium NK3A20]|nr:Exodeoxyribonuclease I subunit D [Lachnospiraceae bacterium NK3A20]